MASAKPGRGQSKDHAEEAMATELVARERWMTRLVQVRQGEMQEASRRGSCPCSWGSGASLVVVLRPRHPQQELEGRSVAAASQACGLQKRARQHETPAAPVAP